MDGGTLEVATDPEKFERGTRWQSVDDDPGPAAQQAAWPRD